MTVLALSELVKIYSGRTVVNSVSLTVASSQVIGLLGPNGAGKTTTFYMAVGMVRPDGSLKPHAEVLRSFVAAGPTISAPSARARFDVDGAAFYADPATAAAALYREFREAR